MKRLAVVCVLAGAACDVGPVHRWSDGRVVARGHQDRHANEGRWTLWAPDGKRFATGSFAAGVPVGIWKHYRGNGRLQAVTTVRGPVLDGDAATWHPNGRPESRGTYRDDRREGPWFFWDAAGVLDEGRTGFYREGERVE